MIPSNTIAQEFVTYMDSYNYSSIVENYIMQKIYMQNVESQSIFKSGTVWTHLMGKLATSKRTIMDRLQFLLMYLSFVNVVVLKIWNHKSD